MLKPYYLDKADGLELCAFVRTLGDYQYARWIWGWGPGFHKSIEWLEANLPSDTIEAMVKDNFANVERADGLGILRAMQDGGWTRGSVPPHVRLALLDMRDAGINQVEIGRQLGLTIDQVRVMANGMRKRRAGLGVGHLVA